MKAQFLRITIGVFALGALLYFMACTSPTPNNNSTQNQNLSVNQNRAEGNKSSMDMKPCDDFGSGHGAHAKAIKDQIEQKMGPTLKKLLKDENNPNGTFTLEIEKAAAGKYYVGYIKGKISGDDNLKDLSDILNDFQSKQDCLRVIFFMPDQKSPAADGGPGFEWSACEYPLVVCPNGECCTAVDPNANSNTNTNTNTHTNSNTNTNANSNRP